MAYSWQQAVWPIPEHTEITSAHFEDLRRYIFKHRFKDAVEYDYTAPLTEATWEAWVTNYFSGAGVFPLNYNGALFTLLFNVVFQGVGGVADLYSCYTSGSFATITSLKNNPPVINGVFNSGYWKYAADPRRYRDFDEQSGRYIVRRYTAGTGITQLSVTPANRYLPKQCQPEDQKPLIQYDDTERKIPDLSWLELNWQYLTQPSTLGPNFIVTGYFDDSNDYYELKLPWAGDAEASNLSLGGWQYALPDGDPGLGLEDVPADVLPQLWVDTLQSKFDPKLCYAYQNHVEQVVSYGWLFQIIPGTEWGDAYIENWNTLYGEDYLWERYGPMFAGGEDDMWGCNCSTFELLLTILGSYDWYWDDSVFVNWNRVIYEDKMHEEHLAGYPGNPTPAMVEARCPTPAGTWRKTWRYTCGRPKWATIMLPGTETPTGYDYDDYSDFWTHWPGIFVPAGKAPTEENPLYTSSLNERHGAVGYDKNYRPTYESCRMMMNDMWSLLEMVNLYYVEGSFNLYGVQYTSDAHNNNATSLAAYNVIAADIWAKYALDAGVYVEGGTVAIGQEVSCFYDGALWDSSVGSSRVYAGQIRITVSGNEAIIDQFRERTILAIVYITPYVEMDWGETSNIETFTKQTLETTIGGYSTSIPTFQAIYWERPETPPVGTTRPSTPGLYDTIPDEFYDWGGWYDDPSNAWRVGKEALVALDMSRAEESGGVFIIPIVFEPPLPPMTDHTGVPLNFTARSRGRADLTVATNFPGFGIILPPEEDIDMTERHVAYTHIPIDDEKFNDTGYLVL